MKALFISRDARNTGAPIALLQTIKVLQKRIPGFSINFLFHRGGLLIDDFSKYGKVIVCKEETFLNRICRKLGVKVGAYGYPRSIFRRNYDFIYVNSADSLNFISGIKPKLKAPVILHLHEGKTLLHFLGIGGDQIQSCEYFIVVSEMLRRTLIEDFQISPEKIILQHPVSPFAVDIINGKVQTDKRIELADEKDFIIAMSGTDYWVKSTDMVSIIISSFFQKFPESRVKFLILGLDQSSEYRIKYDLERTGIADKVKLVQRVANPTAYYLQADILVLPSREESFSLAAQEFALLRKPTVFFKDSIGIADYMDQTCSIQVDYLHLANLVEAMNVLYSDRELCLKMGNNAYEKFKISTMMDVEVLAIANFINRFNQ